MDERVIRAMAQWPDVPSVAGWLSLDRRGRWLLKGEPVINPRLIDFIGRNYLADERGCWYFQNGPQQVWVALELAPLICMIDPARDGQLVTHNGLLVETVSTCWATPEGELLLQTEHGPAAVDDRDLLNLLPWFSTDGSSDPDAVGTALSRITAGQAGDLQLGYAGQSLQVQALASERVEPELGFLRAPPESP